jgi:GNAT superfamily N-acetyltransferase
MNFKTISKKDELYQAYNLLLEIREEQSFDDFCTMFYFMQEDSYRMIGLYEDTTLISVSNIKIDSSTYYGKYIYLYDLVTTKNKRSMGYGKKMINYITSLAMAYKCKNIVLNSLIDKVDAHKFYKRENFIQDYYALVKPIKGSLVESKKIS